MKIEDDRLVQGKQTVEVIVRQPVHVLTLRHQTEQVDHVNEAYFEVREMFP